MKVKNTGKKELNMAFLSFSSHRQSRWAYEQLRKRLQPILGYSWCGQLYIFGN